jgi:isoquinoline 1-oxidoreductase beta subunit
MLPDRLAPMIGGTGRQPPASDLSRRNFLQVGVAAGGGLLLGLSLSALTSNADAAEATSFAPNAFIRIDGDGRVVLTMPYVEMGQGTYTSIPMLIAEELEVDLSQVRLEHAPPDEKHYGNPQGDGWIKRDTGGPVAAAASRCNCQSHADSCGGKALEGGSFLVLRGARRSSS